MTLTSSERSDKRALSRHFQTLRKRIEHAFGVKLEYWKLNTNEGHGVIHAIFKGCYVPQRWLSDAWKQIHGARVVDVRALRNSPRRLANYLVGNYLCKQSYERMSWSWGWVFRGFCEVWKKQFSELYKVNPGLCLLRWNRLVSRVVSRPRVRLRPSLLF
jgi:hypothetical protein